MEETTLFIRKTKTSDGWWIAYYNVGQGNVWVDRKTKKELLAFAESAGFSISWII